MVTCLLLGCQPAVLREAPAEVPLHDTSTAEQAACRAFSGAGLPLLAVDEASAPPIAADQRYELSAPEEGGYVKFIAPKSAEWTLYADGPLGLVLVRDAEGAIVAVVERGGGGSCEVAAEGRIYALKAGAHTFEFDGGASAAVVLTETHP